MNIYIRILISISIIILAGCVKESAEGVEQISYAKMELTVSPDSRTTPLSPALINASNNMRIFIFNPKDQGGSGTLKQELYNITVEGAKVTTQIPIGRWDIVAVSNLEATRANIQFKYNQTKEQLLYEFAYNANYRNTTGSGADCPEIIIYSTPTPVNAVKDSPVKITAQFIRMVGKVTVAIVDFPESIDINGQHEVEIMGIPTKLSFEGGLLNSRTNPETLNSESQKMIRPLRVKALNPGAPATDDAYYQDAKATFIIPAHHNYLAGNESSNHKFDLRISLQKVDGSFYEKVLQPTKSLAANRELYFAVTVNPSDIEFTATILDWSDITLPENIYPGATILDVSSEMVADLNVWNVSANSNYHNIEIGKMDGTDGYVLPESGTTTTFISDNIHNPFPNWLVGASWISYGRAGIFSFTKKYVADADEHNMTYIIPIKSGNVKQKLTVRYVPDEILGRITVAITPWTDQQLNGDFSLETMIVAPSTVLMDYNAMGNVFTRTVSYKVTEANDVKVFFDDREITYEGDNTSLIVGGEPAWLVSATWTKTANTEERDNMVRPTHQNGSVGNIIVLNGHFTFTYRVAEETHIPYEIVIKCNNITRRMSVKYAHDAS